MSDNNDDERRRVWAAAEAAGSAVLVTIGSQGPHARPMSAILRTEDGLIWFMSDEISGKLDEIRTQPRVSVVFSGGNGDHVVLAGPATVTADRAMIQDLWSPAADAFYPAGPTDSDVCLIRVEPDFGELWDTPGRLVSLFRMVAAVATGTSARGIGDHVKTDF